MKDQSLLIRNEVIGCRITLGHPARSLKAATLGELLTELGADFYLLPMPRLIVDLENLHRQRFLQRH